MYQTVNAAWDDLPATFKTVKKAQSDFSSSDQREEKVTFAIFYYLRKRWQCK